jgi:RNA polymerase sigma-70 factor (sigma-E family)
MTTGRRRAASSREDELLSRLYQQVTEQRAARFAAGYDMAAGLARYRAWLDEHAAEEQAGSQALPVAAGAALRAALAGSGTGDMAAVNGGPVILRETAPGAAGTGSMPADWDADLAVTALYTAHYRALVGLAALLVRDVATAEEIVQDSFVTLHGTWRRLRDHEKALSYLRHSVVNRSRSALQHRIVADRNAPTPAPGMPSAELDALRSLERSAVVTALRALPARQREVLVLRYYADLPAAQIASIMGISPGAVKSLLARAMASLRTVLEREC